MRLLHFLPNLLTGSRLLLALPLALAIFEGRFSTALIIAAIAGLTDALDGFLARHLDARSRLGAALDPIADKILIFAVFASLAAVGLMPVWVAAVVILRDVVIVSGALAYQLVVGELEFSPTALSKANMAVQVLFLVTILGNAVGGWLPAPALVTLTTVVLILAIASGLQYVVLWSRKAGAVRRER
ncbi:CDP-alcohol phosphatidyltransferase family protein [Pseudohaliea rubra]|uniref:CDP-diacylglycerol--glycerol-3-phosphate 3-phosphatidyltransferase n=1 Tax=Pseudohaliea rubra DSM 19751 TaxID=1265313 RepID=A0A095VT97_9GAMM|nr:CDP-alcohol phosphatidyltransferase family protein [Pseudohaliea rubra]KGE04667.1 CDP-diacylglycerol--glycerol-3-phosphate 3-phosphatidyltransferase [Pseudohaliea rubra DSM 19751]